MNCSSNMEKLSNEIYKNQFNFKIIISSLRNSNAYICPMFESQDLFKNFTEKEFEVTALKIFRFQAKQNLVYKKFLQHLKVDSTNVHNIKEIPFLPISFFKDFKIISGKNSIEKTFSSSGTTGALTSYHHISKLEIYHQQLRANFAHFYGNFEDYIIYPLLPAYAERQGSSLIEMVNFWMQNTGQENDFYYLYDHQKLAEDLIKYKNDKKVILIGVSFALMDFAEHFPMDLSNVIIMETGGMKGRRQEITRTELHNFLKKSFQTQQIQSEYGMTELLSQAYAKKDGIFQTPPWMKIFLRDKEDPLSFAENNISGGINIIDFANVNSCSFIATDDLGRIRNENDLEILGRLDETDMRGCNLMLSNN